MFPERFHFRLFWPRYKFPLVEGMGKGRKSVFLHFHTSEKYFNGMKLISNNQMNDLLVHWNFYQMQFSWVHWCASLQWLTFKFHSECYLIALSAILYSFNLFHQSGCFQFFQLVDWLNFVFLFMSRSFWQLQSLCLLIKLLFCTPISNGLQYLNNKLGYGGYPASVFLLFLLFWNFNCT